MNKNKNCKAMLPKLWSKWLLKLYKANNKEVKMSKYKELWTHLKEVDGARKLTPHTCFYEKLKELMDYVEELYDKRGEKNFKLLAKKS